MDKDLLDVVACPLCKGGLIETPAGLECGRCRKYFPIRQGIPILLRDEALPLVR